MNSGLVEGASSEKAQRFFDELVEMLKENPGTVYRRLMFGNPCIKTTKDRQIAGAFYDEAEKRLSELPKQEDDFVCEKHQCLASWCGCLEDYRRTHCSCGMTLTGLGDGNYGCPMCSWPDPDDPSIN